MGDRGFPSLPAVSTVELRLLGRVSARVEPGREVAAVLAQPKRVALLGFLAAASPRGFHRRDALLALFWPEADQEHARSSLRKSVHFLRQQLGPEAIVSRGDEEIGLDLDRCWCDVVAFEESLREGQWERAAELYQGDLLPGLHLSDVPEFERWLEETRTGLRAQAVRAVRQLTDLECAEGRLIKAARWARQAVELSPYDEGGIQRLVGILFKEGDRAGAVLAYEQFAGRLSADLELEPSADTLTLIDSIRNYKEVPLQTTAAPPARPLSQAVSATPPVKNHEAGQPASPQRVARRRALSVSLRLLWLGVAVGLGALVWRYGSPPIPKALSSPGTIAILPFEYRGNPELSYLSEGMVDLLSTKLDGAPGVRTINDQALLQFVDRDRGGNNLDRGRRAAAHFGADRFVLGSIVEAGQRLAVSATIYDVEGGSLGSVDASTASAADIFDVADRFARHILSEVQDQPLELARVANQGTSSLGALKAYIEGEQGFRNEQSSKALDAFQRAVQLDSAFALAHYRLGLLSLRDPAVSRLHFDKALRHSGRLGQHERGLIEATLAFLLGDYKQADWLYRQVLNADPDDIEAWLMLGSLIRALGPLNSYAWVDAREAWEQVLKLDPRNAIALASLGFIAARDRRLADLDSLTERYLQLNPSPYFAADIEGQRAVARGDSAGLERFIADLRSRPDLPAQLGGGMVTWATGDLDAGRRLWRLITEPNRSIGMRVLARVTLAKFELTNGRWRAGMAELDTAARLDRDAALEHRGYFALTYFLKLPPSELVALRNSVERWDPAKASRAAEGPAAIHRSVHGYIKAYLLGMVNARLGQDREALRYASELERADSSSPEGAFAFDQARLVRAEIAWRRGRAEQALDMIERAGFWTRSASDLTGDSPFFARYHERFARAELLYELGRMDEALRWYRSLTYDFLYNAPSHYRLAQIYQARGDKRAAIQHYRKFGETWRNSDPMQRPKLHEAELELARLR
jgi:DNA-binding SARP family transcriptional activator/TolB-like protein/Flp pilus assembly protein TadD